VVLAGFIAVDAADADRVAYAEEIAALRALTLQSLSSASSGTTFVYLQQTLLGFDGDEVWGKQLDLVNDGEADVQCPACNEELLVDLTSDDPSIEPGLSSPLAVRLHAEAVQAALDSTAAILTRLFGRLACCRCGTRCVLADHLTGISYE
jgi:hypothetical protein